MVTPTRKERVEISSSGLGKCFPSAAPAIESTAKGNITHRVIPPPTRRVESGNDCARMALLQPDSPRAMSRTRVATIDKQSSSRLVAPIGPPQDDAWAPAWRDPQLNTRQQIQWRAMNFPFRPTIRSSSRSPFRPPIRSSIRTPIRPDLFVDAPYKGPSDF